MIYVKSMNAYGIESAVMGMRNPMNSWAKSDSGYVANKFHVGEKDLELMHKLYLSGSEHRKFLRQIFVSMDVLAPLYWWKEFDQYKVGVVTDSCSTMYRLTEKEFTESDFSFDHVKGLDAKVHTMNDITLLNKLRNEYLQAHDKDIWYTIIQLLPSSYMQFRTVTMNYENAVSIIRQRSGHKLNEWNVFVEELEKLPYIRRIIGNGLQKEVR